MIFKYSTPTEFYFGKGCIENNKRPCQSLVIALDSYRKTLQRWFTGCHDKSFRGT